MNTVIFKKKIVQVSNYAAFIFCTAIEMELKDTIKITILSIFIEVIFSHTASLNQKKLLDILNTQKLDDGEKKV